MPSRFFFASLLDERAASYRRKKSKEKSMLMAMVEAGLSQSAMVLIS